MAETTFTGPLKSGEANGTGKDTVGFVPVVKRFPVSADGSYAIEYLPDCNIIAFWVNVEIAYSATAQSSIRFGTSADPTKYAQVNVSSVARYDVTSVSGVALNGVTDGSTLIVDVTSVGSAGTGQASVYVMYQQL
jgi:hypothetical protein